MALLSASTCYCSSPDGLCIVKHQGTSPSGMASLLAVIVPDTSPGPGMSGKMDTSKLHVSKAPWLTCHELKVSQQDLKKQQSLNTDRADAEKHRKICCILNFMFLLLKFQTNHIHLLFSAYIDTAYDCLRMMSIIAVRVRFYHCHMVGAHSIRSSNWLPDGK